jgi:ubiquinone/menaquinone biosynthesis C-methylase UbiE
MQMLNIGCGSKFHNDWINMDMASSAKEVRIANFLKGIPLADASMDVVYHSHVLEHFSRKDGEQLIAHCSRVLKPGGIIRIALPNLEVIVREYLANMEKALAGDRAAADNYDWMLLEMYDQTVRNKSGGEMGEWLFREKIPNEAFVLKRVGTDVLKWREAAKNPSPRKKITWQDVKRKMRKTITSLMPGAIRKPLEIGQFRTGGEIHQWMYDRYSLKRLLEKNGFSQVEQRTAITSYISNWQDYGLDNPTETASLFMEAIKQ